MMDKKGRYLQIVRANIWFFYLVRKQIISSAYLHKIYVIMTTLASQLNHEKVNLPFGTALKNVSQS